MTRSTKSTGTYAGGSRFLPLLHHSVRAPNPYCYRCYFGQQPETCDLTCAKMLELTLEKGVNGAVMGFGSGPHRCVGEFLAIAETQVFLERLLALPGLRIVREPRLGRNDSIQGYELRDFLVEVESGG